MIVAVDQICRDSYLVCTRVSWYCSRATKQIGMLACLCKYWASNLGEIDSIVCVCALIYMGLNTIVCDFFFSYFILITCYASTVSITKITFPPISNGNYL